MCGCHDNGDFDPITKLDAKGVKNVGGVPYYGPDTRFYGEDATPERIAQLKEYIRETVVVR